MKIYRFISYLYSVLVTIYEEFFLSNKKKSNESLINLGFQEFNLNNKLVTNFEYKEIKKINDYLEKLIFSENEIFHFLKKLLLNLDVAKKITDITGFKYSIDFFTAYRTYSLEERDKGKNFYANDWHIDKPYSKNTLKIVIPLKKISNLSGGLKVLNKSKTKDFFKKNNQDVENYYEMISDLNSILVFNPNQCMHKAGVPKNNHVREQIILQLNPSKNWSINSAIYKKQFFREPKFPIISYFFDKRRIIC